MCGEIQAALDALETQPNNGGMPEVTIMVFKKVIKTSEEQSKRVTKIEKDVSELKEQVNRMEVNLDEIIKYIRRPSWLSRFWEKRGEQIVLFLISCAALSLVGVSATEVIKLFFIKG